MLNIEISNVGKIKKASIEMRGITVVAGLNGTGKSTIAKSIFSAVNSKKNIASKIRNDQYQDIVAELQEWFAYNDDDELSLFFNYEDEIAERILDKYEKEKFSSIEALSNEVEKMLEVYCSENDILIDNIDEAVEQVIKILTRSFNEYLEFFVGRYYQDVFKNQINRFGTKKKSVVEYRKSEDEKKIVSKVEIEGDTAKIIGKPMITQQENAIYIETHSALDMCEEFQGSARQRIRMNKMTVPTKELITYLFAERELSFAQQQQLEANKTIIAGIVKDVTHGHLQKNQNGMMEFVDSTIKQKVEFSNMSAGLKIFTLIQRLLENYSLKASDVLIVDEPEVNLHPKWQVVLAELLVRIHKELGIYIMINSHSPYFIRAIEVKMAEYECALDGTYYFLEEENGECICKDVSNNREVIYDALYQPLNSL